MSDVAFGDRSGEAIWPLQLTGAELAELFGRLGLSVDPASPLAGVVGEGAGASGGDSGLPPIEPALARALRVLAAPRQLLLVGAGEAAVLGFLNDGERVVRFDAGAAGCTFAEPCEHAAFGRLICSLAGVSAVDSDEDGVLVGQPFLGAIAGLRMAGLFARGAEMTREEAELAVAEGAGGSADPAELFRALEAEGPLAVDGSVVRARDGWAERYPYLARPAGLKVDAIELGDIAAGRSRRKGLAVLGEGAERLVFLPPTCDEEGRDVLLELEPATIPSLAGAVERLLAPPLAPPFTAVADLDGPRSGWLEDAPGAGAIPEWRLDTLEDLLAPPAEGSAPPPALLAPGATVEVLAWGRGGRAPERTVLALDSESAVEWTLDGSLVRWRALAPGRVAPRIAELVPVAEAGQAPGASVELSPADLEALLAASAPEGLAMPAGLRDLAGDGEARWYAVRAGHRAGGSSRERFVLAGAGPSGGAWRLESSGDALTAHAVGPGEVQAELLAALTPGAADSASRAAGAGVGVGAENIGA